MSDSIKNEGEEVEWEEIRIKCPKCDSWIYEWAWEHLEDEFWCQACGLRGMGNYSFINWERCQEDEEL